MTIAAAYPEMSGEIRTMTEQEYKDALRTLSDTQLAFVTARMGTIKDKDAAEAIGLDAETPSSWPNKQLINELVKHARLNGVEIVREELRRAGPIAVRALKEVVQDRRSKGADKVQASNSILDRIGVSAKTQVELSGTVAYVKGYVNVSPDDWPPPPTSPDDTAGER